MGGGGSDDEEGEEDGGERSVVAMETQFNLKSYLEKYVVVLTYESCVCLVTQLLS